MRIDDVARLIVDVTDSPVAVVAADAEGRLSIVDLSAALLRLRGRKRADLIGQKVSALFALTEGEEPVLASLFGTGVLEEILPVATASGKADVVPVSVRPLGEGAWLLRFQRRTQWPADVPLRGDNDTFYRHAMEAGSDWTWATDATHRIIYLSSQFSEMTGLDPGHAFGRTRLELADSGADPTLLRVHAEDLDHLRPFRDFVFASATGGQGIRYFRVSGAPIFDGDGEFRGYCGTGSDVTAEILERRAAQEFESRVITSVEELNDGFALFDAKNRLVLANGRFRSLFAAMAHRLTAGAQFRSAPREGSARSGVGRDFHELAEAALIDPARAAVSEEYRLDGGQWLRASQTRLKDGGLAIVVTDITRLKQAEEAAARAESRLIDAIENLAGAFMLWDADDRLVLHNTLAKDLYGKGDDILVVGLRFEDVLRRAIAAGHLDAPAGADRDAWIAERVRHHRDCAQVLSRRYPDGRWVRITEHRTRDDGVVAIGVDITELKRRQFELEAAHEQAEQANRAKSRFLAAASHDLRQPLHAMGLFVSSLANAVQGERNRELIAGLQTSLDTMNELFSALLDLSRLEAAMLKPEVRDFRLEPLLERMRARFTLACAEKKLSFRVLPSALSVRSDPGMLERILSNFIANAVRYTASGGIVVGCRRRKGAVSIEVWDTGPGIPRAQLGEIFKEYHQLANPERDRRQGLGLGLAIVDRLSRLLKHRIEVTSRPGKGSMFAVVLPVASPVAGPPEPAFPASQGLTGRLVLVIDDDEEILAGTRGVLEDLGCAFVMARTADAAVAALAESVAVPDLVLADYRLPDGRTGAEAIARIRAATGVAIPGIIVSGDTAPDRLREVRASGFQLLHKPVHAANLAAAMRFILKTTG